MIYRAAYAVASAHTQIPRRTYGREEGSGGGGGWGDGGWRKGEEEDTEARKANGINNNANYERGN
jgi:hypothetical protein